MNNLGGRFYASNFGQKMRLTFERRSQDALGTYSIISLFHILKLKTMAKNVPKKISKPQISPRIGRIVFLQSYSC